MAVTASQVSTTSRRMYRSRIRRKTKSLALYEPPTVGVHCPASSNLGPAGRLAFLHESTRFAAGHERGGYVKSDRFAPQRRCACRFDALCLDSGEEECSLTSGPRDWH